MIPATSDPPFCPQTGAGIDTSIELGFDSKPGNEDCLFLNVYAPANARNLPVFVWIRKSVCENQLIEMLISADGGGYNLFSATGVDATPLINTNDNQLITVAIQYRLGAFGFLPGDDVKRKGALNAGLLDMNFALKWVQKNIHKFGGDPSRVTIGGESGGGGAVMYQAMAYGGKSRPLFNNIIAQSPWIPSQYNFNDPVSTAAYTDFAKAAGCGGASDKFRCLVKADTAALQNASFKVSESKPFGVWAFLPVTDGTFVQQRPTTQLISRSLQGKRILSGHNANEGVPLSPPTAVTSEDFRSYLRTTFPSFSPAEIADLESQYSYDGDDLPTDPDAPRFETSGTSGPTALNQSGFGTGQQQRIFNVFAEYAFDCPAYWLASAFQQAWKYQYSLPPAYHGADLSAYWSNQNPNAPGRAVKHAIQKIWGNFVIHNTPVISIADATGGMKNATVPIGYGGNIKWDQWSENWQVMLNLNTTGGVASSSKVNEHLTITTYLEPGVTNQFSLVDAYSWEGGRGRRCQWWKKMAPRVPY